MPHKTSAGFVVGVVLVVSVLFLSGPPRAISAQAEDPGGYRVLKTTILGGTTGWDYLSLDSVNRHLFMGRMKYMEVFDVDTDKTVAKLTDLPGDVGGIVLAPQLNRGFTNGGNGTSKIIDLKTLQGIGTVKSGPDPDSYSFDPLTKRVFFMNSEGRQATAIDAATGEVVGSLPLNGQPEFSVSDGNGHIFVNITDNNQMLEFDARTLKELHRWPLGSCTGSSGLSMDQVNRRLFSVCDNEQMVVMNADTGKIVATLPTGPGDDCSLFDPYTYNAFASNGGSGTLTIIHEYSPDDFRVIQTVPTAPSARTMALDTKTHDILLVAARYGHGYNHAAILPNTFKVIVVGK